MARLGVCLSRNSVLQFFAGEVFLAWNPDELGLLRSEKALTFFVNRFEVLCFDFPFILEMTNEKFAVCENRRVFRSRISQCLEKSEVFHLIVRSAFQSLPDL